MNGLVLTPSTLLQYIQINEAEVTEDCEAIWLLSG